VYYSSDYLNIQNSTIHLSYLDNFIEKSILKGIFAHWTINFGWTDPKAEYFEE
jgi:hypothetical protein